MARTDSPVTFARATDPPGGSLPTGEPTTTQRAVMARAERVETLAPAAREAAALPERRWESSDLRFDRLHDLHGLMGWPK